MRRTVRTSSKRSMRGVQFATEGPRVWVDGRAICRWCGGPVTKPRRTFCSNECVGEWAIRSTTAAARTAVLARDRGICALCRLDCEALAKELRALWMRNPRTWIAYEHDWTKGPPSGPRGEWRWGPELTGRLEELGIKRFTLDFSTWQADHVIPVSLGGHDLGLENLRTLCWECHRLETSRLAREKREFIARSS